MIFTLISKNLRIIFRSPSTIILVLLAPIILMLLVGISFSGTGLSNTVVGLVNSPDKNIFNYGDDIKFVRFDSTELNDSFKKCEISLKQGDVELCIHYNVHYDEFNNVVSANVVYLIDDTRYQMTGILLDSFDRSIETLTKQISKNTIETMFTKTNKTLVLMKDSRELIKNLSNDMTNALIVLNQLNLYMENAIVEYSSIYDDLGILKNTVNREISNINSSKNTLSNSLNSFDDNLNILVDSLDDSSKLLQTTYDSIYAFSLNDSTILNTVDLDDLRDGVSSLNYVKTETVNLGNKINLLENNLNILDSFSEFNILITETYVELGKFKYELSNVNSDVKSVITQLKLKQKKIKDIENVIDENIGFFSDLLSRDASDITDPISREIFSTHENLEKIHQLSPSVIMIILLFIGLLLSNIIVSLEINSKAYFRNVISPISQNKFIMALFFTALIIILFQMIFLFLVLVLFFSIPIFVNFLQVMLVIIHVLVVFILLGILLAYLFSSLQISILVTTFVMLFFFLLSNSIVSIELMPNFFSNLVLLNPIVIGEDLTRKILYHSSLSNLNYSSLWVLYVYYIILIGLIGTVSKKRQENSF
jgi:ABC-type multidrug transport system permease subunit